jgi:hypothetical protein
MYSEKKRMMFRRSAYEHWCFRGLLAALLFCTSAAKGIGQPFPYTGGFAPGAATGGASTPPTAALPQPLPGLVSAQPPVYSQPAPRPRNTSAPAYSAQPPFATQPLGYGPLAPPPQTNGAQPLPAPRNGQPPFPYTPMPPGEAPTVLVQSPPVRPSFQFHTSNYWAQGLNLGFDIRF